MPIEPLRLHGLLKPRTAENRTIWFVNFTDMGKAAVAWLAQEGHYPIQRLTIQRGIIYTGVVQVALGDARERSIIRWPTDTWSVDKVTIHGDFWRWCDQPFMLELADVEPPAPTRDVLWD
jgi:hypothetical protein